jgi:NTE family protein
MSPHTIRKTGVSLALGSGAAKGLAHIGIINALKEAELEIKAISGTSMGALIGACYANTGDVSEIEEISLKIDWKQVLKLADPKLMLMSKGMIHGQKVKELLRAIIGNVEFKDLKIPLFISASDTETGEEVVIKDGPVVDAVMASIAIPGIFMPVKHGSKFLIDGGIVNPVPVSTLKKMDFPYIIGCNVIDIPSRRTRFRKKKARHPEIIKEEKMSPVRASVHERIKKLLSGNRIKIDNFQNFFLSLKNKLYATHGSIDPDTPNIFKTVLTSFYIMQHEITQYKMQDAQAIISPSTSQIAWWEFYRAKEIIHEGYLAAKRFLASHQIP